MASTSSLYTSADWRANTFNSSPLARWLNNYSAWLRDTPGTEGIVQTNRNNPAGFPLRGLASAVNATYVPPHQTVNITQDPTEDERDQAEAWLHNRDLGRQEAVRNLGASLYAQENADDPRVPPNPIIVNDTYADSLTAPVDTASIRPVDTTSTRSFSANDLPGIDYPSRGLERFDYSIGNRGRGNNRGKGGKQRPNKSQGYTAPLVPGQQRLAGYREPYTIYETVARRPVSYMTPEEVYGPEWSQG